MKYCNVYDTNKWFQSDNVAVGLNVMDLDWIVSKWDFGKRTREGFISFPTLFSILCAIIRLMVAGESKWHAKVMR